MSSMKPKEWWLLIILSVFWGGSFFFVEVALLDFEPFTLVFLRIAIAALILVGVLIGFIGVYLMMKPELTDGFSWRGLGQAAVLGGAVSYSFAAIFGKRFKEIPAVVNSAGMLICSSIIMLPLVIFIDSPWSVRPSLETLSAVLGIAVISTAIAYLLYFHLLATAGATNVLLVTFLIPISALLLGVGILGEVIKVVEYAGMGCIFLGLIIIDGRALGLLQRLTGRRAIESREETVSKAAS